MPTLMREAGFRIYFYSHEPNEPAHVHVDRTGNSAKYWLSPLHLAANNGFSSKELKEIREILSNHREPLMEAWRGYFSLEG